MKHLQHIDYFRSVAYLRLLRRLYLAGLSHNFFPNGFTRGCFRKVNRNNAIIIDQVLVNTESRWIVDSSKDTVRFAELHRNTDLSVFPVVLVRYVESVLSSKYMQGRNLENVRMAWLEYYNKQVLPLLKDMPDDSYAIISYERFIAEPQKTISAIADKLDLDASTFSPTCHPKKCHLVAGNPVRYTDPLRVKIKDFDPKSHRRALEESGLDRFFFKRLIVGD